MMRLLLLLGLILGMLNAESRYALLIGNSDYKYIDDLQDPSYNISRLKKSLEALNFIVTVEKNLNSENLEEAIDVFAKHLSKDKSNIGFIYYSGHGCQLNHQGYLVPTDVDTKNKVKIKHRALSINEMLDTLSMANNRVNMLFLDACRDVPTGARGGTKGLGQPTATPKGSLVVYATEAGKTADDNSNFINALINNINKPNQKVKDMADSISNAVANKTREKQIPVVFYKRLPQYILLKDMGNKIESISNEHIANIGFLPKKPNFPHGKGITRKKGKCNKNDNGCGVGLSFASFNNYIDSGGGVGINDERKFLVARNITKKSKFANIITASHGDKVQIQGFLHNNAYDNELSLTAKGVIIRMDGVTKIKEGIYATHSDYIISLREYISSQNTSEISDNVIIKSATNKKIELFFVKNNNYIRTVTKGTNKIREEIKANDFFGKGSLIQDVKPSVQESLLIDLTVYVN